MGLTSGGDGDGGGDGIGDGGDGDGGDGGDGDGGDGTVPDPEPVQAGQFTYRLTTGDSVGLNLWTGLYRFAAFSLIFF